MITKTPDDGPMGTAAPAAGWTGAGCPALPPAAPLPSLSRVLCTTPSANAHALAPCSKGHCSSSTRTGRGWPRTATFCTHAAARPCTLGCAAARAPHEPEHRKGRQHSQQAPNSSHTEVLDGWTRRLTNPLRNGPSPCAAGRGDRSSCGAMSCQVRQGQHAQWSSQLYSDVLGAELKV